jgi:2-polyprenyl-3-methyl-5-hydroxy-6-metoxy-1,4-benzoquinol methylase
MNASVSRDRGAEFKQLQRDTYSNLYSDLDFALYKVGHPFRKYFEHHIVSLALKGVEHTEEMTCLDIGCGQGITTYVLSKRFKQVVGMDFSPAAINTASAFLQAMHVSNASVAVGDVDDLGLARGSVDIVHFKDFLHHTVDPLRAMRNLREASRAGHVLGAEVNGRSPLMSMFGRLAQHERGLLDSNRDWLANLALAAGFKEIRIQEFSFYPYPFRLPIIGDRRLGFLLPAVTAVEGLLERTPLRRYANYLVFDASS